MDENQPFGQTIAQWQIPEYEKYKRNFLWYLLMGGSGLALFIYSIWIYNFLFAVIIVIIATIIMLHERRDPDMLDFKILEDGIQLEDKFVAYKEIKKFWIIYEPPEVKNLYFYINKTWRPELSIPLKNMNPILIRKYLLKYLKEDLTEKNISADDQFGKILKI